MRFLKIIVTTIFSLLITGGAVAQTYADSIAAFRKNYVKDLLGDPRAPIKSSQVKYLDFFQPDHKYCVVASYVKPFDNSPFMMDTHSGKQKPFRDVGMLFFTLNNEQLSLHVYQVVDLVNTSAHKDELFIPFNDLTNYETTYAGGRYIDLTLQDIRDGKVVLDFNKCYNPYCAYADGFSCPIPPKENSLHTRINAGEKMFQH